MGKKEEPQFFINDFLVKSQKELQKVLKEVKHKPKRWEDKTIFLREFTTAVFNAYRSKKIKRKEELKKEIVVKKEELKKELEAKRAELIKRIEELKKPKEEIPVPKKVEPVKEMEGMALEAATPKPKVAPEKIDLIKSKGTGKVLVTRTLSDSSYELIEPSLSEDDLAVINELKKRVKKKDFDNNKKLEKLMKQQTKKHKIEYDEGYYDKVRYYLVRDLEQYGKVSALLEDKNVKEVSCEGVGKNIKIKVDGNEVETNVKYSKEELDEQLNIFARIMNQKLTPENPFLSGTLPNGKVLSANLGTEFVSSRFAITG